MGIDYSGFAFPKGALQVEQRREKRLDGDAAEDACRKAVWKKYGRVCNVPGCKEKAVHQHHIVYRSRSKRLKYSVENRAPLCQAHHDFVHAGKIEILPRKADGELIVNGPKELLKFKL